MGGHVDRSHSLLSASGAFRWINCTPSAKLETRFPDKSSSAAAEGTLAHELAELKVRNFLQPKEFGKRKLTAAIKEKKEHELWDDEMMGYTDEYLEYIKRTALAYPSQPSVAIEKRVYFGKYTLADPEDENEGYGTADCILIGNETIHVIDLKYGKSPDGRVSAEGNPQMALYALGAYETYKLLYPVKRIKMTIVQPRLSDGISEWDCPLEELLAFGEYVKGKAALALKGEGDFRPDAKTCKYCRARGQCRARADENVKLAFFTDQKPPLISNDEVGEYLKQGEDVAKWLSDLKDFALAECLAGREVPGWKAVEGRGSRDWTDMDLAFNALTTHGINDTVLWERKPLTLAQVEKVVGKKEFNDLVGSFVVKAPGKPALVKASDNRKAITNVITAAEAFKEDISHAAQ